MPQSLLFQDETQEFRATVVPDGPRLQVTDDRIRRFVNAAQALNQLVATEHVDWDGARVQVLLADGRTADFVVTGFGGPTYVVVSTDQWSEAELNNVGDVIRALGSIHTVLPLSAMRWEKL